MSLSTIDQTTLLITPRFGRVRQLTHAPHGHTIANRACWSADGSSILYDLRQDETIFDSPAIERVIVGSGQIERLFESQRGACCGVPTCSPTDDRYVFIHGDEDPDSQWSYCAWHRRGAVGTLSRPLSALTLDARDIAAPYTAGALRGGTHLHMFSPRGAAVLSTYEDHVLANSRDPMAQSNRRALAITVLGRPVSVPQTHVRNHSGIGFTVCVTRLTERPVPGSDEILMATGEAWLDDGSLVAFQGTVVGADGNPVVELFLLELPSQLSELCRPADHPLCGTPLTRPGVPMGVRQRRLSHTSERRFPGVSGPRHWAAPSPDGKRIGCYMRDDLGHVQFWTLSPDGGDPVQVTALPVEPTSAFSWHPDGSKVAFIADRSVLLVDADSGQAERLTLKAKADFGPTHHACAFSPDGSAIAYMQPVESAQGRFHQLHVVSQW